MTDTATRTDLKDPPLFHIDPYSTEVLTDPHPFYRKLREAAPVVELAGHGVYAVGGYAEARQVITDHSRFSGAGSVGLYDPRKPGFAGRPPNPLETDPPEHTQTRAVANRIMSPLKIRRWRALFEEKAAEAVDRILANGGEFDGVRDLVEPVVFGGFPVAMGIRFNAEAIRAIGYMSFNMSGPQNELFFKGKEAGEPWADWFAAACERDSVQPGSIADEFFAAEAAGELRPGFATSVTRALVRGGMDTTMSGMTGALRLLAEFPDQWRVVEENPARIRAVFDEALRYEPPTHIVFRTTLADCELSGYRLRGDTKIAYLPGAANRDPRQWENPDKFDVMRDTANIHMSFGMGEHNCIGQNVARMEAEVMLRALFDRVKRIEMTARPRYLMHNQLITIDHLPLRAIPR
ncbi:cytochrome P450 [Ruixingdingia sedimenti]|uniref:Cytochrome P450 n=1 Tax=Ruixingdingia sedimenti TaxID=3073604 RepID=A0ABU1F925_9RHOB|nr:cytochrome P450 [Xinfangfangia sp. LG-4]MDR5653083.1 cytochrome P450 [Xinfangfangia sp. LG-4]